MRILIVEDEEGIAKNIAEYLRQHSFAVDIALDGKEGWEFARSILYDVILLDWMLPGMSGLDLCAQLRAKDTQGAIIMLTAKDTLDDKVEGLTTGADDYIVKPFELRELLARIQTLLRRQYRNQPQQGILQVGDLTLDLERREAARAGTRIILTKKLFQLLEFLMRNADRVVSKSDIETHIWDTHAELWSDVVRSHLQKLREKVDKDFEKKLIHTVHGIGYKISADE